MAKRLVLGILRNKPSKQIDSLLRIVVVTILKYQCLLRERSQGHSADVGRFVCNPVQKFLFVELPSNG